LLLSAGAAIAGDKAVKLVDMPKAVQETIHQQSQGARIVGTKTEQEDGKMLYELESVVGDHRRDLLIDPTGKVVEIEVEVALTATPPAVRAGIEKNAGSDEIVKIESMARTDEKVYAYDVRVRAGAKKRSFRVALDGTLVPHGKG
jgi:hypothetical protein